MTGDDEHLSALWLATLQRVTDRVAHEIRNALNGVAVNVEVVRTRAARGGKGSLHLRLRPPVRWRSCPDGWTRW
jgi:hypothetical protein